MDDELLSCLSLFLPTIKPAHFSAQSESIGLVDPGPEAPWFMQPQEAIRRHPGFQPELFAQALEVQDWCQRNNAQIIFPGHSLYPAPFRRLEVPPTFLSFFGSPAWQIARSLAVVGSREASGKALDWMDAHLARFLAASRFILVSGGARGVDQKAHLVCLRAGRPTVAFLPSGLGRVYPQQFQTWVSEILKTGGAVVSEFAPLEGMKKYHFLRRNRLIASLGETVFVVEAARKSGSIMTARLAQENMKTICVLPSFPGEPRSSGTLDLLFDGAFPIRDAEDLLALTEFALVPRLT